MKGFSIKTEIQEFDTFEQFAKEAGIGADDLVLCGEHTFDKYIAPLNIGVQTLFREKYGKGEPTDGMVDAILNKLRDKTYDRIIAVGGGTVIDIAKVVAVAGKDDTVDDSLPYKIFATSSIDAMVHSVESFLSPNGCSISRIFSTEALKTILTCWKKSVEAGGEDAWKAYAADFLKASNWAGLGFGYAGCAAVHACAYPLGSVYHIPHGQSNQLMFKDVMKMYKKIKPTGRINDLEAVIAESLSVAPENALEELYALMDKVLKSAPLEEFGVKKSDLAIFAGDVIKTQQRLLRNNYVQLSEEQILEIYEAAY